jgi:pimeloyl-ACP methyl ester carboxylesterase
MNTESLYKSARGESAVMALYADVLAHWPVPQQTLRLPTRHGETFVIASGDPAAPPLVMLHGAASNALAWAGDVTAYCAHFRTYAVDIPGDPGRSAPNRLAWDGPGYAEWLEDVLDGLHIQTTALLGISQGGWTALKYATYHPARVERLVLLAPGGVVPTRLSFILAAIVLSPLGRWGARRLNQIVFGRQAIHPEALKFMEAIMTHFKPRIGPEYLFRDDELRRLAMPILLLGGTEDAIRPMHQVAARMCRLAPQVEATLIPGMGHVLVGMPERVLPFLLPITAPQPA